MGAEQPPVVVDPACFLSLVNSAVEVYNRETTGLLVGRPAFRTLRGRKRKVLALEAAYPYQTAWRNVTWVEHGNHSATHRARTSALGLGFRILGEYHSHTNNEHALSQADVDYVSEALRRMNGSGPRPWLEVIVSLKRKAYAGPREPGFRWRTLRRKVGGTVVLAPRDGFDVTLAGYWIQPNGNGSVHCDEATLRVPWERRRSKGKANGEKRA